MQKLFGTVVPIVTPLTEEDTIDVVSLRKLLSDDVLGFEHINTAGIDILQSLVGCLLFQLIGNAVGRKDDNAVIELFKQLRFCHF